MPGCSATSAPSATGHVDDEVVALRWISSNGRARITLRCTWPDRTVRTPLPGRSLDGGDQTNPDWSPDGERFVFAMNDGKRDDLWVADADGSDAHMLLDCTRQLPLAGRPRLVAGRQADHLQPEHPTC